ncbi:helix-turn-helix transcriptional regulator [Leucobacter aridicollis]|uniref:Proteasome accessory factor C n=1 Tax=Leucobacter aridicollis TaxID=283878 RepID=A0A852REC4_9MICO|nr:WYL domain-containing protein [Leucobacter aridicollis]MBL3683727.1 WYL domain-containing protein [Leucobacter aridicollis]NYD26664.1 proteasome accessory factor C [Leucobacter aridicollis]
MARPLLASDKVLLLLSLVPYLREHGPTPIPELARTFEVEPRMLRSLIGFLGTAGIPGETLSYQHNDLFDIDWDEFEERDTVSLTQTVAIDDTPRFTGVETAALLAGLAALKPLLAPADAQVAADLGARLGAAMGSTPVPSVAVSQGDADSNLSLIVGAIERGDRLRFSYRDAAGAESARTVDPASLTDREGTWYLHGYNVERDADRTFSVAQISDLSVAQISDLSVAGGEAASPAPSGALAERSGTEILAVVPTRLLGAIRGFAPEVVAKHERALPEGTCLVRVDAWHPGAAVRLAQHGPGEIEIVAPLAARAAVSEWAESALRAYGE